MFAYTTIGSTDFAASTRFFDAVMAVLGYGRTHDLTEYGWVAYGDVARKDDPLAQQLWLSAKPFNGEAATVGNGSMMTFQAPTRGHVDLFYTTALSNGGTSEGAPGIREMYGPDFYLAYVRCPMGNKFAVICRKETA